MSGKSEKREGFDSVPFPKSGDEVVISGIAGRFPESDNVMHLQKNLFNKVDLITDDGRRWKLDHPEIPQRHGKINGLSKFDAEFFGFNFKEAHTMDPMGRMLLEHAYEAIMDAGVNPRHLRGTRTGVFIGFCYTDSANTWHYTTKKTDGHGVPGCSRGMMANRISHWLGCNGPSYTVDTACSSSLFALDQAYRSIRTGECDAAIIGGSNLCLHPTISRQFFLLGVLSRDGCCKSFDAAGNGYCRSEAVCVIYLQKSKDAKRIYAQVVHAKTNCDGFKKEGITFPSNPAQRLLFEQFYNECQVPPSSLAFMEAHGTGTPAGDPVELDAIDSVFCPGRTTPFPIGSVKSNLGHTEPASGLVSIAKVIIAMESGYIAPNLHYNRPREGMAALEEGRIKVLTELTPWEGGYVGVNSFGFGGANAHILLKSNPKEKNISGKPTDNMPRLVVISGRTQEAVATVLDHLESRPVDVEYVSLLHDIYSEEVPQHPFRGYTILPASGLPKKIVRDIQPYVGGKRPVCFIFPGMGSEWSGVGIKDLLKIPVFAKAVHKCGTALKLHGLDIIDILTNKDPEIFHDISNSCVGFAVVQVGLVDVLASIGITAGNVIGHSMGELGCAYADGCLTAEQTVLAAHSLGLALIETETIRGSTASIGIDNVELENPCPTDTGLRHTDGHEKTKYNDLPDSVEGFAMKLQAQDILISEERSDNIAYHSRYVAMATSKLLSRLQHIIQNPKPRSEKWLSASAVHDVVETSPAQLCSPEFLTRNLLSLELFEEKTQPIPNNAITIEIEPYALLRTTPRKSSKDYPTNIPVPERGHEDSVEVLLQAIGKMYEVGLHPQLADLYPRVQYPVSRGTPMISPLLRWEHTEKWAVRKYNAQSEICSGEKSIAITLDDERYEWMAGHVIDGRILVPATSYLILIWETVAQMREQLHEEFPIVFEDVRFHRATTISKGVRVKLNIMVQQGSGRFEVSEGGATVVTGSTRRISNSAKELLNTDFVIDDDTELDLTARDVYKELRLRGYHYTGLFRGVESASLDGARGRIAWKGNWVAFMDNMLQMKILGNDTRGLFVPTAIQKMVIDPKTHLCQLDSRPDEDKVLAVQVQKNLDVIVSGGIEIRGLKASAIARRQPAGTPVLENFKYIAHRDGAEMELKDVTRIATHIALENQSSVEIKTIELIDEADDISPDELTSPVILEILGDLPLLQADVNIIAPVNKFSENTLPPSIRVAESKKLSGESGALLVVGHGLLASKNTVTLKLLETALKDRGFLMSREPLNRDQSVFSTLRDENFDVVLKKRTCKELIIVIRRKEKLPEIATVVEVNNKEFTWVSTLQAALKEALEKGKQSRGRILLVSQRDFESGLMGLVNCLRKEPGGELIQGLLIQDLEAPKFSLDEPLYAKQLELGLALNVLRPGNLWGSYQFFAMDSLALKPAYHARISQHTRGDLSAIRWVEGILQPNVLHEHLIRIYYSSINFRDVMLATGKLAVEVVAKRRQAQESVIGFEFSGRDANGRAVMGLIETGALSNLCVCDKQLLWEVPDDWTLEDAATVPAVYGTAYYALYLSGNMKRGDKVLIHAGSGGVGQAAITLALHEGCEVFTTVGTPQKREFIRKQFPQIAEDHIGNSRDTSFEQLILRKTHGRGVDIVLNSLAEEKLQASVRCLAHSGRFLEIGKFDLAANSLLGMEAFLKGISFHGVLLDNLFNASSDRKAQLVTMLDRGIKSRAIKPLIRTVFPMDQTEAAFRYMAAGKHIGKVIVKVRDEDDSIQSPPPMSLPRFFCLEDCSYLILGGLGGFGLELADWLVLRGAKKLVLTSRKGISNGYQRMRINTWKSYGVGVVVVAGQDASTHEGCEAILKEAIALGPVDAIFNLAVVLKDAFYENQTAETFEESFRVKAWATKQLDRLSRKLCPQLRQFVVFSSVSCGRGNAGQTNYGMANSIMERICETRAAENLPGLAIQWGAIGDVGLVAEMQEDNKELVIGGTLQQRISSCLQELDGFLQQNSPVVSSMVVAEKKAGGAGATNILEAVSNIMGIKDLRTIGLHVPLAEMGMDSMMAVEIKQTLEREHEVFLTASDIRNLSFAKLQEMSQKQETADDNSEKTTENETGEFGGLKMLIRTLGTAQFVRDICVPLATKLRNKKEEVFILPGIEGTCTVLEPLAEKLKSPATCLQLAAGPLNLTSIDDMADCLFPHVTARSEGRKDFVIVGYSFGSIVAIELVRRLESEGFSGRLVLIDGSPEYSKALIAQFIGLDDDDQIQSGLLLAAMNNINPSAAEFLKELQYCNTWEERLTAFTKSVPEDKSLGFTVEDQRAMCTSTYGRLKAVAKYNFLERSPLRTPITLLKPTVESLRSTSEDYGLSSITQGKVDIYYGKGDHLTILEDDICAAAIDGELTDNVAISHSKNA